MFLTVSGHVVIRNLIEPYHARSTSCILQFCKSVVFYFFGTTDQLTTSL